MLLKLPTFQWLRQTSISKCFLRSLSGANLQCVGATLCAFSV